MKNHRSGRRLKINWFALHRVRIACASIVLAFATVTRATLTPTVFIDTPTELAIVWDWDEFSGGGGQGPDLDIPPLVNWSVLLTTVPAGPIPTWTVDIGVFHITDPHPGDVGGGNIANLTKIFDDDQFPGMPVLPDVIAFVDHPAIGHGDGYEMQVFHSSSGTLNTVKLIGVHIPEPGTLSLLGLGGLTLARRRRQVQRRKV